VRGFIVGGGPESERLKELAAGDRVVQVLGERLDIPDILGAADVSCLSSAAEGMPMSLLEAMALEKPVVATDVGGVAEAVEAEKTGILVPPGDQEAFAEALLKLAANPALAQQLGKAGRQRYRDLFFLERMIADYARAFEQVLGMADARNDSVQSDQPTGCGRHRSSEEKTKTDCCSLASTE
jgi:glycosyltransferase involved in cell wall biosynthesis